MTKYKKYSTISTQEKGGVGMNKLKAFRKERKLTQTELAARSGISQRYIAFIESGDRTPSLNSALRIADVLGRSVEEIFFLPNKCTNST